MWSRCGVLLSGPSHACASRDARTNGKAVVRKNRAANASRERRFWWLRKSGCRPRRRAGRQTHGVHASAREAAMLTAVRMSYGRWQRVCQQADALEREQRKQRGHGRTTDRQACGSGSETQADGDLDCLPVRRRGRRACRLARTAGLASGWMGQVDARAAARTTGHRRRWCTCVQPGSTAFVDWRATGRCARGEGCAKGQAWPACTAAAGGRRFKRCCEHRPVGS